MRLWLDDLRPAPPNWVWCKTLDEVQIVFMIAAREGTAISEMSFDHDLGEGQPDGYDVIKWIVRTYPSLYPWKVSVHSANPVGAENIRAYDEWFRRMAGTSPPLSIREQITGRTGLNGSHHPRTGSLPRDQS